MAYAHTISNRVYRFADLTTLLAKATPERSGDQLAGIAAESDKERMAARVALADLPLRTFLDEQIVPYEVDEVTRLIVDTHDAPAFAPIAHLTVGGWRDWLLSEHATPDALAALAPGLTPEMVAAVSKLMRNQDLIVVARKCRVVTRFRNTLGLPGRLAVRLQPNHPTDDLRGIAASMLDGLLYGSGDAVIGINPASDSTAVLGSLVKMLAEVIERYEIPTQSCVLTHVTNTMRMIEAGDDPLFLLRRMIIFASEDVGNADPRALMLVTAADAAFRRVGMPEGLYPLAQACTYLAATPKSNASNVAFHRAKELIEKYGALPVPKKLRPGSTALNRSMGYGANYKYAHDFEGGVVPGEHYLPDELVDVSLYEPTERGEEARIKARLAQIRASRTRKAED